LYPVAEKRGVQAYCCASDADGAVPSYAVRRKIEHRLAKVAFEHLIVYVDGAKTEQIWQWVKREPGRPIACREHTFYRGQSGDALLQKLERVTFRVSDEELLTLPGVVERLSDALDKDRITKRFYDRFKEEHGAFLGFVDGIREQGDQEWYASIMLNRLMFVYFIQKKEFLDGDPDYLRNRLERLRRERGGGEFHTFYRYFLRRLFHEGLGQPERARDPGLDNLLGRVPYLNGGLFDVHALEDDNPGIDIPDEAFDRLFAFFDAYTWHLDERPLRDDREINPDVLGYIFEKYINQKQMGAYYTKEDITGYIARSTIVPWILDAACKECRVAFDPAQDGNVWRLLRANPDRYIWPAVRHGVIGEDGQVIPLPPEIEAGVDNLTKRVGWNRPADLAYALPTETWREHVDRRQRCLELRRKLFSGEVQQSDDLVTHNLNLLQFAQDAIETCEGPETLRAFYAAVRDVTVLDPTCGSGAFLFAALNVLDPLHDACLDWMRAFVSDLDREGQAYHPGKFTDFRQVLEELDIHPSQPYFVLKQIVLNNLYGVDIMEEAVEICKLRLFLKLVAQLETAEQIEPLPDIDFNVRAGNTLIGFASYNEVKRSVLGDKQTRMDLAGDMVRIEEHAEIADRTFQMFHRMQTEHGMDGAAFRDAKAELRRRLTDLGAELDRYLATEYGVDPSWPKAFAAWRATHQPFHWFVDFYGIMKRGGFDVIIGNPPYIELKEVARYKLYGYACLDAGNIYALVLERCSKLSNGLGRQGFIVPVSSISTDRYRTLQTILASRDLHFSSFDDRPSRLFDGLEHIRLTIHLLGRRNSSSKAFSTQYHKWSKDERTTLFSKLTYVSANLTAVENSLPRACYGLQGVKPSHARVPRH
ncbi:MAG: Eco57I restriction-modification methylase domain-containing protein, partial [Chloroflexota bacterium]|nr:Eco57I restriction-modification methylase domain-containing protein [Chloroflexota bacterium]